MLPLIPTLTLALFSFICSAFVILRIVIPVLPPHPLSRRVPPSEFGLPSRKALTPADKSHIWLATCDIIAIGIFVWQAFSEYFGGPSGFAIGNDPASAVRLWVATTLRQSCLLIVAALTLLHVRMGQPVSFGTKHWMLWAPTLLLAATSTILAGVLAGTGIETFFWGLVGYSTTIAILSSISFACLIGTLVIIKRNLAALNEIRDPWPPAKETEDLRHNSFASEDINALKEGNSWVTSHASSHCDSISAFSFSTQQTHHSRMPSNASRTSARNHQRHPAAASDPSILPQSSFWFNNASLHHGRESPIPPVPPLPALYRPSSPASPGMNDDPDPFRCNFPRPRLGSQSSWLTEPSAYQSTLSAWSFPASRPDSPAGSTLYPSTPDLRTELLPSTAFGSQRPNSMLNPDILGGYGHSLDSSAEKGIASPSKVPSSDVDVSVYRALGWLIIIWIPQALVLPNLLTVHPGAPNSFMASILLVLSVALSGPLLALNIICRSPLPIPSDLFDSAADPPSIVMRAPSPATTCASSMHEYKRSASITVVEGRRSGDVWLANGDAVEGKSKFGRAMGLLQPKPKLAVLPPSGEFDGPILTRSLPIKGNEDVDSVPTTPQNANYGEIGMNVEIGTRKKDSKASSHWSSATDESSAFQTRIMVAQRHYSTLATTVVIPASPERRGSRAIVSTSIEATPKRASGHLRARSISSMVSCPQSPFSAPPSSPLPPTPPTIKERKAARGLVHRKSRSSLDGFSFGPIDDTCEIDALSAGLLPLLVPGLKISSNMKIVDGQYRRSRVPSEIGGLSDFLSPQLHSTPLPGRRTQAQGARPKKTSGHKRHHFSLPSLSLSQGGTHELSTWRNDISRDTEASDYVQLPSFDGDQDISRNTFFGSEYAASIIPYLKSAQEEERQHLSPIDRFPSSGFSDMLDVPEGMSTAHNSFASLITVLDQEIKMSPLSAGSDATLFDFHPSIDGAAESTPNEPKVQPRCSYERPSPVPKVPSAKSSKRSSIVYIKSDDASGQGPNSRDAISEWSNKVRPLAPRNKAQKLQMRASKLLQQNQENAAPAQKGLRTLSLLQDREPSAPVQTRPLTLNKKSKGPTSMNENIAPTKHEPVQKKSLKPLRLGRSETTKQRALLRNNEIIPDVVIRPPSNGEHFDSAFNFRS